jgi:hypothetical protein
MPPDIIENEGKCSCNYVKLAIRLDKKQIV